MVSKNDKVLQNYFEMWSLKFITSHGMSETGVHTFYTNPVSLPFPVSF